MFDKKYKKTLEILDSEIEMYYRLYLKYLDLAECTKDEKSKIWHLDKASEYREVFIALSDFKKKLYKEIEL